MDVYSSLIKQMSDARLAELRREAVDHAAARAARADSRAALRAHLARWLERRRRVAGPEPVTVPVVLPAPAVERRLGRTA